MNTFDSWLRALCGVLLLTGAAGCKVEFPNDVPYTCATDADCGGDGYLCTALPNDGPKYCCLPDPAELCNGVDDDCDGAIDELEAACYGGPPGTQDVGTCRAGRSVCDRTGNISCAGAVIPIEEECNTLDDDCDGRVDEDFDLQTDPGHCGQCGRACTFLQNCTNGECVRRGELDCGNGADDEGDGATDCADRQDCDNQACGSGCVCRNGARVETNCGGGGDEDGDGLIDCADRDNCDNQACGEGCVCNAGTRVETACRTGSGDEDGDGDLNCADSNCLDKECGDGLLCRSSTSCEEGDCGNGVDDDGDTQVDCADTLSCGGKICGEGCTCTGGRRVETNCSDGVNNDDDALIDCADPDCNLKACSPGQPDSAARCEASVCAEENCRDTLDNDNAEGADCADRTDCDYAPVSTPSGQGTVSACIGGAVQEVNCSNNLDDDGDGAIDCRAGSAEPNCVSGECGRGCRLANCVRSETNCGDNTDNDGNNGVDCADRTDCDNQACGNGCICDAGTKKETICNDRVDNDGNNQADCSDQADCPQGTACTRTNGQAGTCQSNRTCG
ncbi:hypothetical protein [Pyxidicoccus xibeiensis]|uniref:hypothetical protein n=1 Tax=Pyxidicoccus xibeiensis TaxID=2906759 RepID=UPI0020A6E585|nr:hypothetical protein [Pyxidicoccus xibeiensis]MCP3135890.1 hypothetical protein [Pyxidicoccus xibeiensis]